MNNPLLLILHGILRIYFLSIVPPDAPSTVVVTATTTQLSLSWTNPSNEDNSPVTMVIITYQLTGSQNVTETADTVTSHTITGLMPNMEYIIFLQSFNAIGGSESVSVTGMTLPLCKCNRNNHISLHIHS